MAGGLPAGCGVDWSPVMIGKPGRVDRVTGTVTYGGKTMTLTARDLAREAAAYTQHCPVCGSEPQVRCVRKRGRAVQVLEHPHEERMKLGDAAVDAPGGPVEVKWTQLPELGSVQRVAAAAGLRRQDVTPRLVRGGKPREGAPPFQQLLAGRVWVLDDAVAYIKDGKLAGKPVAVPRLAGVKELAELSARTSSWASEMMKVPVAAGLVQHLGAQVGPVCVEAEGVAYLKPRRHPGPQAGARRRAVA